MKLVRRRLQLYDDQRRLLEGKGHARSRADWVRQELGVLRHFHALAISGQGETEPSSHRRRCNVIGGGTEPTRYDHEIHAAGGRRDCLLDIYFDVTYGETSQNGNASIRQRSTQPRRVRVDRLSEKQFVADRDDGRLAAGAWHDEGSQSLIPINVR